MIASRESGALFGCLGESSFVRQAVRELESVEILEINRLRVSNPHRYLQVAMRAVGNTTSALMLAKDVSRVATQILSQTLAATQLNFSQGKRTALAWKFCHLPLQVVVKLCLSTVVAVADLKAAIRN